MHPNILIVCLLISNLFLLPPAAVQPPSSISTNDNLAKISFPEKISFSTSINSETEIKEVVLEYGVNQLTCGNLISKSFPDFKPGKNVSVEWTWEMKQTGSIPTGSKIWWRWNITDTAGGNLVTDKQTVVWIDSIHPWKTLSSSNINLHWYQGDEAFGKDLHNTAVESLAYLEKNIGLTSDEPVDIFIYPSSEDLSQTVYYQPDWTGGLAYPENNVVLIGIPSDQMVWGRHAETHELTHVLVGHFTFSCLSSLPNWLSEGLAKYSEGDWDQDAQDFLKSSIKNNRLFSVRALSSSFPEDADKASLAYEQSHSLVKFLLEKYGQEKMTTFLKTLRDGAATDAALQQIYGFDQDGLEDAWRSSVGAQPRSAVNVSPTPTVSPTHVPTIVPISGVSIKSTPIFTSTPVSSVPTVPIPLDTQNSQSLIMTIVGLTCCCMVFLILIAITITVVIIATKKRKN